MAQVNQVRKAGESLIPEDVLEKIPNRIPINKEESPVYGKIVDASNVIYYIYAKKGDVLHCLVSTYGKNYRYGTVSLSELENKKPKGNELFIPWFQYPEEFAIGDTTININSNSYRKNIKVHTILNGILK